MNPIEQEILVLKAKQEALYASNDVLVETRERIQALIDAQTEERRQIGEQIYTKNVQLHAEMMSSLPARTTGA